MDERIVGGQEGHRDGGCGFKRHISWQHADRERGNNDMAGESPGGKRDNAIADVDIVDVCADPGHDASALHTQLCAGVAILQRFFGQQPQVPHDVAEI